MSKQDDAKVIVEALVHDGMDVERLSPKAKQELRAAFDAVLRIIASPQLNSEPVSPKK